MKLPKFKIGSIVFGVEVDAKSHVVSVGTGHVAEIFVSPETGEISYNVCNAGKDLLPEHAVFETEEDALSYMSIQSDLMAKNLSKSCQAA